MESKKAILPKLFKIQQRLKVSKDKTAMNRYNFRSAVDILEALKPLLAEEQLVIEVSDVIVHFQDEGTFTYQGKNKHGDKEATKESLSRFYTKATATIYDCETGEFISSTANAREDREKAGMDVAQLTGSSSSYARKYALGGLFGLDDSKDPDEKGGNK